MILLDANVLVYLYNSDAPEHKAASTWLEAMLADGEDLGVPLPALWAFIRLATNRAWRKPLSTEHAFGLMHELLGQPGVHLVEFGRRHLDILEKLATEYNVTGPRIGDAVLAALAIEHGAALASADRDFRRFETLRWINPLAG